MGYKNFKILLCFQNEEVFSSYISPGEFQNIIFIILNIVDINAHLNLDYSKDILKTISEANVSFLGVTVDYAYFALSAFLI